MKFDIALKHVKVGETIGPLERTDRYYACCTCGKNTGWRTGIESGSLGVPVCSDECLDAMDEFNKSSPDDLRVRPTLPGSESSTLRTG